MTDVAVLILHPAPGGRAGSLKVWVAEARAAFAEWQRAAFLAAGADTVTIVGGPPDERTFGSRIRDHLAGHRARGLVVLGSGTIPLATAADRRALVAAAASSDHLALANNRYSADVVAISRVDDLPPIPDLATDNALPRWLAEVAGWKVDDQRRNWRLGVDIDGPLDLALIGRRTWLPAPPPGTLDAVSDRLAAIRSVGRDARAELLVAGRVSAAGLAWLERATASRTRALIEERGLRTRVAGQRAARSSLGLLLDRDGPGALGRLLAELGDAALVDSRVLLAHRLGADERDWPGPADRFASDLLLPGGIGDPWLRELTASAAEAPIPVVLGGHTLVGPGLRLALTDGRPWT